MIYRTINVFLVICIFDYVGKISSEFQHAHKRGLGAGVGPCQMQAVGQVVQAVGMVYVPGNMRAGGELADAQRSYEKQVNEFLTVHATSIGASDI